MKNYYRTYEEKNDQWKWNGIEQFINKNEEAFFYGHVFWSPKHTCTNFVFYYHLTKCKPKIFMLVVNLSFLGIW